MAKEIVTYAHPVDAVGAEEMPAPLEDRRSRERRSRTSQAECRGFESLQPLQTSRVGGGSYERGGEWDAVGGAEVCQPRAM